MTELVRFEVRSRDRDTVAEACRGIVDHRARIALSGHQSVDFWLRTAIFGEFRADLVRGRGLRYTSVMEPIDHLMAGVVVSGTASHRSGPLELRAGRGDGFLTPMGRVLESTLDDAEVAIVSMPLARVAEAADHNVEDFAFLDIAPVSAKMGQYWHDTIAFVHRQLTLSEPDLPPLVLDHLFRLVSAAAAVVFPNTSMTTTHIPADGRASSAAVRRAVDFIEEHAGRPLTVEDIAAAAGVGSRALQSAFRQTLDRTPMQHLRLVRLQQTHRELQVADPRTGATVAAIAQRWGFLNLGRYAHLYRTTYGRSPHETLRNV